MSRLGFTCHVSRSGAEEGGVYWIVVGLITIQSFLIYKESYIGLPKKYIMKSIAETQREGSMGVKNERKQSSGMTEVIFFTPSHIQPMRAAPAFTNQA